MVSFQQTFAQRLSDWLRANTTPEQRAALLAEIGPALPDLLGHQEPPPGDWRGWLLLAGRGAGKTYAGARATLAASSRCAYLRGIGPTYADARDVMVEGEALALDTPIPTPSGWTTMGDLAVGDEVFARDGSATQVIAVSPVWTDRPCYVVKACGAEPIVADSRHQWVTSSRAERRPDRSARGEGVRTTEELAGDVRRRRADLCEHEIPMHDALEMPDAVLPVPPYTLGAWLGDGDTRGYGGLTCHPDDAETIEHVKADGFTVVARVGLYAWGVHGLRRLLRNAGIAGNKHIPIVYLRASSAQRLALLQGLMDTDGYVSERGQCAFDNTNLGLVEQVRELLLTLGYKPGEIVVRPNRDGHKTMYRVTFTAKGRPPFRLSRKAKRCLNMSGAGKRPSGRLLRDVEAAPSVATRCIQVAHPSGTFLAGRDFVVTHNSGLLSMARSQVEAWNRSLGELRFVNGARLKLFSADEPDRLRGPQSGWDWYDELAAWRYPDTFDQALMGLRLGADPRWMATTTPRPTPLIKRLVADPTVVTVRARTLDNVHLPDAFKTAILARFSGTRQGRQELDAEILEDTPGALWSRAMLEATRVLRAPDLTRVVVGVDPPASSDGAECGIIGAGRGLDGHGYTLADLSVQGSPATWAAAVIRAYVLLSADRIVAEKNQGGEMVEYTIRQTSAEVGGVTYRGATLPITLVSASRGKVTRAEPIAALMEQGCDHHVGAFPALEDQLCSYVPGGASPDRMDARVWAYTELFPNEEAPPKPAAPAGMSRPSAWRRP